MVMNFEACVSPASEELSAIEGQRLKNVTASCALGIEIPGSDAALARYLTEKPREAEIAFSLIMKPVALSRRRTSSVRD